ncbi:MAG: UPF0158 family protein [bacterium]
MRKLRVLARDLVFALQGRAQGTVHYLDLETGAVIPVFGFNRDRVLATVRATPSRYTRLAPRTGRRDYEVMARFVETVDDDDLRGRLRAAIAGENVFSGFRSEVDRAPAERARWERYRAEKVADGLRARLAEAGIALELVFD